MRASPPAVNRGAAEARGEWLAVLNSDVELAPDYLARLLPRRRSVVRHRQILRSRRRAASAIDGTFDAVCRGGTAWRVGNGRADGRVSHGARHLVRAVYGGAVSHANFSRAWVRSRRVSNRIWKMSISACGARAREFAGLYVPGAVAWHRGSATLGAGIRTQCAAWRATSSFWWRAIIRRGCCGAGCWPIVVAQTLWGGVALRHGAGIAWLAECAKDCAIFQRRVNLHADRCKILEPCSTSNERRFSDLQTIEWLRSLLETVLSANHRWGKVTHGGYRNRHRHL